MLGPTAKSYFHRSREQPGSAERLAEITRLCVW